MKECRDLGRRGSKREGVGGGKRRKKGQKKIEVEVSLFVIKNKGLNKPGIRNVLTKPLDKFVVAWQ